MALLLILYIRLSKVLIANQYDSLFSLDPPNKNSWFHLCITWLGNCDSLITGLKLKIQNNILITHHKKVYDLIYSDTEITKYFNLEPSIRKGLGNKLTNQLKKYSLKTH